eukprot:gene20494-biopygen16118
MLTFVETRPLQGILPPLERKQLLPGQSRKSHFKRLSLHKSSILRDEELYRSAATLRIIVDTPRLQAREVGCGADREKVALWSRSHHVSWTCCPNGHHRRKCGCFPLGAWEPDFWRPNDHLWCPGGPASTGPPCMCLIIALWIEIRFLHSESKTHTRAEMAIGPPCPPAKRRPREADVGSHRPREADVGRRSARGAQYSTVLHVCRVDYCGAAILISGHFCCCDINHQF